MSPYKCRIFSVLFMINIYISSSFAEKLNSSALSEKQKSAVVLGAPVFKPALDSVSSLNLLSSFPEDFEINEYCSNLLHIFGQRYVTYVNCLVPAARPVKVCQNCYASYGSLVEIYKNISSDQIGPSNVSCGYSLLHSDRLMLVYLLFTNLEDIWTKSDCDNCIVKEFQGLTNGTKQFLAVLNQTFSCFEKYKEGNHTELCKNCKSIYSNLNTLYNQMEKDKVLCIDLEDSMNLTRSLWSRNFNCSIPREETVPVIAVSSFMLFLPIIFYLSSYLHSEQKKRKLIHPKRAKSYAALMNIQDKQS